MGKEKRVGKRAMTTKKMHERKDSRRKKTREKNMTRDRENNLFLLKRVKVKIKGRRR